MHAANGAKDGQTKDPTSDNPRGHPARRGTHNLPILEHPISGRRLTSSFPVRSKWTKYDSRNRLFNCIPFEYLASVAIIVAQANQRKLSDSES